MFSKILASMNIPLPVQEYKFHPDRKFRFDYAWPEQKIALEQEGGIYGYTKKNGSKSKTGAHSSVTGILRDIEKYNLAALNGWRILRTTPDDLMKVKTLDLLKELLTTKK